MHWTLKSEATRPASPNFLHQQERFDNFQDEYNNERPHEALDMKTPSSLYSFSKRPYSLTLQDLIYPLHDATLKVEQGGMVTYGRKFRFYLSQALKGEKVGLREISPKRWLITFMNYDLGYYDERTCFFTQDINEIQAPPN